MELNRLGSGEWLAEWRSLAGADARVTYSELFFHPEFGLRPRPYPLAVERLIARGAPALAATIARQVDVRVEARSA
jgi:hypothetical protein